MWEFGDDEFLHGEFDGVGGAGEGEEEGFVGEAGDGAGEHGGGADVLVAEHAEEFAEALEFFVQESADDLDGGVAGGDAGAAGGDDDVEGLVARCEPGLELGFDLCGFVFDECVVADGVAGLFECVDDGASAGVGLGDAGVADGEDGTAGGLALSVFAVLGGGVGGQVILLRDKTGGITESAEAWRRGGRVREGGGQR